MAISHQAATRDGGTSAEPLTISHNPGGTPKGVLVLLDTGPSGSDLVTGVTYGGVALAEVAAVSDTAGEPQRVYAYFLGSSIPTGTQTCSISGSWNGSTTFISAVVITVGADAAETEVVDFDTRGENQANPQIALDSGAASALRYTHIFSGLSTIGSLTPVAGMSTISSTDFGSTVVRWDRRTSAETGSQTIGYTSATDDVAMVAVAIAEVSSGTAYDETGRATTITATTVVEDLRTHGEEGLATSVTATSTILSTLAASEAVLTQVTASTGLTDLLSLHELGLETGITATTVLTDFQGTGYVELGLATLINSTTVITDRVDLNDAVLTVITATTTLADVIAAHELGLLTEITASTAVLDVLVTSAVELGLLTEIEATTLLTDTLTSTEALLTLIVATTGLRDRRNQPYYTSGRTRTANRYGASDAPGPDRRTSVGGGTGSTKVKKQGG